MLHIIGIFYITKFPILYASIVKSRIYMIQHNVFTDNKCKSLVTLIFTHYIVSVESNQYWKALNLTGQCQECFYTERHWTWALFL